MTLVLNNEEIQNALSVNECLNTMEESYLELAASRAVNRPTSHTYLPHSQPHSTYSFKSVDGGVAKFGVLAAETGELLAIMPDGFIQQTRVAVTSALGAKALARSNAETLALIGSGGQARAHYRFLTTVRPIKRVKVFSPNPEHRKSFAAEMARETGIAAEVMPNPDAAVRNSDIICSATNSSRPVVDVAWLEPGVHYNAIREFEMDEAALEKSDVVAIHTRFGGIHHFQPPGIETDLPGVRREKPRDWSRYPELCDILAGTVAGRSNDRQITFFLNNIGTGVQFAAIGYCAYKAAKERGLGREIPTDWFLQDIKP